MSKRSIFPQQSGDRKKPRLDTTVLDHNFPISQNAGTSKATDQPDSWGDDIEDEVFLQVSHECEEAWSSSMLPAYSQFKPPALTSTQMQYVPTPGPSKGIFSPKVPSIIPKKVIRTIDTIGNYSNDKVLSTLDPDYLYKQLLNVQEENEKLKSENGKLLEKCDTKEGEASILRTQLKSYQVAMDNARLEKLKTQEQAQIQYNERLNTVNQQLSELQTQLDFKKLDIVSLKEKCKMLESNKIKRTQITVAGNEMSSHRLNNSTAVMNSFQTSQPRRLQTASSGMQTDNGPQFIKLTKGCRIVKSHLMHILPIVIEPLADPVLPILDYNEKLKRPTDLSPNKCRIFSTFHRLLSNHSVSNTLRSKTNLSHLNEDITSIASNNNDVEKTPGQYINIFNTTTSILEETCRELEIVSERFTSAFQKEMDKRYMESTMTYTVVDKCDLIAGKKLFKEEQALVARRMTALLHYLLEDRKTVIFFNKIQNPTESANSHGSNGFIELLYNICNLMENNFCALYYSGLLLSIVLVIENLTDQLRLTDDKVLEVLKLIITSRAMLFVPCRLLKLLVKYYKRKIEDGSLKVLCSNMCSGRNVKTDNDQGVIWFKKDTCLQQVLVKQVEAALKCMERQRLMQQAADTTRDLLQLHSYCYTSSRHDKQNRQSNCEYVLLRIIVYALKICSASLDATKSTITGNQATAAQQAEMLSVCRNGLQVLYQLWLRDVEFVSQLGSDEGHLVQFCEHLRPFDHSEFYATMLTEVAGTFQAADEVRNLPGGSETPP